MFKNNAFRTLSKFITLLALTSISCGVSGLPFLATETPTPTLTFTPSPTSTPSATPTLTSTPTPLPTGRITEEQSDGTTLFTDYDAGYKIAFPKNWVAVIPSEQDIQNLLTSFPDQEQNISSIMELIKNSGGDIYRVFAFNFKATDKTYTPNINIAYQENIALSAVPMEDFLAANLELLPSLGIEATNSGIKETSSGLETGFVDLKWTMNVTESQKIDLTQKQVYFKSGEGMVVVTISSTTSNPFDFAADVETLIESIQLLGD